MLEMDGSAKPPQISEMFQKFALAFKTKTIEFFAEEEEVPEEADGLSLLDSAEGVITGQRVVVIKPDQNVQKSSRTTPNRETQISNLQTLQALVPSLFATVSSFEAAYLQLQMAHTPFDSENMKAADRAAVSHLQKLSEIKQWYRNFRKNPDYANPSSPISSPLEAQVQENQNMLRVLDMIVNRLQSDIDLRDAEVSELKQKLCKIQNSNLRLSKRLSDANSRSSASPSRHEVFLSLGVFDSVLQDACGATHRFTKLLVDLMKKAEWDLDMAANSVYPDVEFAKKRHNRYVFMSYVSLVLFRDFDLEGFGVEKEDIQCNGLDSSCRGKNSLKQFIEHATGDAMELLSSNPTSDFGKFCEKKYQALIHPTMESSLFKNLEQNEAVLNSWRSSTAFYESFVNMASSVWMLHKLAFSFNPVVDIFQVENGVDFSMIYMENVLQKGIGTMGRTRPKVRFTVIPGFRIGSTVIQCKVYLTSKTGPAE